MANLTRLSAETWIRAIREGGLLIVLAVNLVGSGSDSSCIISNVSCTGITYLRLGSEIRE